MGVLVGLFLLGGGTYFVFSSQTPANMSATATGTVTSVEVSHRRRSRLCTPVAAFEVGGKPYTASTSVGVKPCPWTVGQPIAVMYDPASSTNAIVPSPGSTQVMPLIFIGAGALLTAGSAYRLVRKKAVKGGPNA